MKQGERKAVALGDDAAVICECSNNEAVPAPRLTIHNAQYAEEGNTYPATSTTVFGQPVRDLYEMLHEYYSNAKAETSERSGDSSPASCSVCVHGHDLEPREGSMVVCAPQHKAHDPNYCCTGFRRITLAEIDERTEAKFGIPNT